MKNKKSIYILLPVVLFIWSTIIYQFFSFSKNENSILPTQNTSVSQFKIKPKDTFAIIVNERDPFLGKLKNNYDTTKHVKRSSITLIKIKEELIWPDVKYKGIVSDTKEKIKEINKP